MTTKLKVWMMSTQDIKVRITEIEAEFDSHEAMDWDYFMSTPALALRDEWEYLLAVLARRTQ